jgi:hypothetical protein
MQAAGGSGRRQYRSVAAAGAHRGDDETDRSIEDGATSEESKFEVQIPRKIERAFDTYVAGFNKNTEFFTNWSADELVHELGGYL